MRNIYILTFFMVMQIFALKGQVYIQGKVYDHVQGKVLAGANVTLKRSSTKTTTDSHGNFSIFLTSVTDTLLVSFTGYLPKMIAVNKEIKKTLTVVLESNELNLKAVEINTGYYKVSPERATGSFTHLDNNQINRNVSTNILDRLEGVAGGLNFDRRHLSANSPNTRPKIEIRGLSTIESNKSPLIVVDNFPYENDITTINPNDVESITILKDAAAASIWGARAGNGVIVITTKTGRYNQKTRISFNTSLNIGNKPDLFYDRKYLPSSAVMEIEKELYNRGGTYSENPAILIPPYVELLISKKQETISAEEFNRQQAIMETTDTRAEALKSLYQRSLNQQYAINISGGGNVHRYYFSSDYDQNRSDVIGNTGSRLNLNLQNTFKPIEQLEITAGIWYTMQKIKNNGLSFNNLSAGTLSVSPYLQLADEQGNALAIPKEYRFSYQQATPTRELLDWTFKPLDEVNLADNTRLSSQIRLIGGLKYNILNEFNINATYQYTGDSNKGRNYYNPDSYYVRNLVNRFTQSDGTRVIPTGGILEGNQQVTDSHSGRVQLNYTTRIRSSHSLTALAGAEVRQLVAESLPGFRLYDYNSDVLTANNMLDYSKYYPARPEGALQIPAPPASHRLTTDRYLSYFVNASDIFMDRYILSGSIRWDGSNLFGVNSNQKGVPLWSAGVSWELSKEKFYSLSAIPYLRLRATYGSSGNVNPNVSAFPVASYIPDLRTGLPAASLIGAGNPNLRWETVKTTNLGMDFALLNQRLKGSMEYYIKNASDLIGIDFMDPTTGIFDAALPTLENKINYANLKTKGFDLALTSYNLNNALKWETTFLFSYNKNEVTHFSTAIPSSITPYLDIPPVMVGKSLDVIYALPWNGLDPSTGQVRVNYENNLGREYESYYLSRSFGDLIDAGVTIPPYFGSLRNTFSYKNFQLSANLIWKAGYTFRRSSMVPGAEYVGPSGYHVDYFQRWTQPGDELKTNVPARSDTFDSYQAQIYNSSTALITKGDYIRIQDVNLSYRINGQAIRGTGLTSLRLYMYLQNPGILWRANKQGIDPDYINSSYPNPKSFSIGLNAEF
ncbi:SusC/RagA family TonB-linked outer membrane protein [Pedobacter sp. MC2016-24]|uniref:SusC/RagA family TonB-linked outer membrane protein n=1 Tax=Pedobacter sp. MC2016-24 TaxID=2780090 RepID=UPI0018820EC2|nr:SusC/RagA family TonB-linked outer membrane protein [Pedobacter sp. MC2016-24]MBE9599846.1 SusC/RagA family TonB-linked outer membrane protein [Pedobacter sp. MC2016-24]